MRCFEEYLSLFWCGSKHLWVSSIHWNFLTHFYHVLYLDGSCFLSSSAKFSFFGTQMSLCNGNDDSFFLSWLNATTVSINIFLWASTSCLVWHLSQLFSSRPNHSLIWLMYFTQLIGRNGECINNIVNHGITNARCQIPDSRPILCYLKEIWRQSDM